uniref:PPPDE domain-containing protein n=1 Tax=Strigamia maritima TaxID=126957 RepID=T1IR73_STRMM
MSDDDSSPDDNQVRLYIYDLSKGLAKALSNIVLGKQINGLWHTAIVVYGREYFYGSGGIESTTPGTTVLGSPNEILDLGTTQIPYSLFLEYIFGLGETIYVPDKYHLCTHNCNNFTQDLSKFLTGTSIPEYITNLPQTILDSPIGDSIASILQPLDVGLSGGRGVRFGRHTVEHAEQRLNQGSVNDSEDFEEDEDIKSIMSAIEESKLEKAKSAAKPNGEEGESEPSDWEQRLAAKRAQKNQEPPIVFKEVDAVGAYNILEKDLMPTLNEEEMQLLTELKEFVLTDSGAWALGGQHLQFITQILVDTKVAVPTRRALLQFLQAASLKEDVILLLHMDRKEHVLMNYINEFESIGFEEQEEIAKMICNMCLPYSSSDWLLYISEWQKGSQSVSNSRVTTRVAVNSLLSDKPQLIEKGIALMYNLGLKEVFDDTATELSSAVLQYLHGSVDEESAFKVLTALNRFMQISYKDVPQLVKMIGPDLGKFKGKSDRLDHLLEQINYKVNTIPDGAEM